VVLKSLLSTRTLNGVEFEKKNKNTGKQKMFHVTIKKIVTKLLLAREENGGESSEGR
jgi:hypothetical protein